MAVCPVCNNPVEEGAISCSHCGFKLYGATQKFDPVAFTTQQFAPIKVKQEPQGSFRVIRGPQIGMVFALGEGKKTIGRSPACDIFLNDMTVSRQHATIESTSAGYRIKDTNSFNGVWVNNASVNDYLLKSGDIVQIGAFLLLLEENENKEN